MADATRDVVIRLALETAEGSVRSVEKANKAVTDSYDYLLKRVERTQQQLKDDAWAEEQQRQSQIAADAAVKFGSSLMQVGEASLRAARGIAFLIAANEDDARAMMRHIAIAQGAFDIIKGGVEVIKAARSAYVALTTATEAATAANTLFQTSMGPIGWAIAGITIAIGAAALAYRKLGDDAEESASRQLRAMGRLPSPGGAELAARRRFGMVGAGEERARFERLTESVEVLRHAPSPLLGVKLGEQIETAESLLGMLREMRGHYSAQQLATEFREWAEVNASHQDALMEAIVVAKRRQAELEMRLQQQTP